MDLKLIAHAAPFASAPYPPLAVIGVELLTRLSKDMSWTERQPE